MTVLHRSPKYLFVLQKKQAQRKSSVIAIAPAYTGRVPIPTVVDSSKNGEQWTLSRMICFFFLIIKSPVVLMFLETCVRCRDRGMTSPSPFFLIGLKHTFRRSTASTIVPNPTFLAQYSSSLGTTVQLSMVETVFCATLTQCLRDGGQKIWEKELQWK